MRGVWLKGDCGEGSGCGPGDLLIGNGSVLTNWVWCWGRDKKEAQIEIQAVAKIQYPIKSHIIYIKSNSTSI